MGGMNRGYLRAGSTLKMEEKTMGVSERLNLPKQKTPLKAIKSMCVECLGGPGTENLYALIRDCAAPACPLYEYRMGKNPYLKQNLTDEQRKERSDRAKKSFNIR
jgi:hypothetical protein